MTFLNGARKRRLIAKETHRIAVQGIFVGIIIKAGGASVTVTDLLFAFAFCEKQTRKTGVLARLAVCCLLISINKFSEPSF